MIVGNHARVWEYDGAFKCLDCQVHWGALPGHPQMPENCVCSESDQEDVRAQVEGIATLLKASIPPGKDIHGRPSPPSEKPQRDVLVLLAELRQIYGVPQSLIDELAEMDRQFHAAQSASEAP